jgi:uncharacterized protein with GYD domain
MSPSSTSPTKASRTTATPSAGPRTTGVWSSSTAARFASCCGPLAQYDLVVVTELPDDETAIAVVLQTVAAGNVRTTTLKAFDAEQMSTILQRTG